MQMVPVQLQLEGWWKHRCSNTSGLQRGRSESFRIRRRLEEPPRPPPTDEHPPPSHSCPGTILWSGEVAQMKQITGAATPARIMAATGEASTLTEERRIHASGTTTCSRTRRCPDHWSPRSPRCCGHDATLPVWRVHGRISVQTGYTSREEGSWCSSTTSTTSSWLLFGF